MRSAMRFILVIGLVGILPGCNQLSAEPTPSQCEAWARTYVSAIRGDSVGAGFSTEEAVDEINANGSVMRDLSPKIEQCRNLGYLSRSIPVLR